VFVGLGTTGTIIVTELKKRIEEAFGNAYRDRFAFFAADTHINAAGKAEIEALGAKFHTWSALNPNALVADAAKGSSLLSWWPFKNVKTPDEGRSTKDHYVPDMASVEIGAGGIRSIGRLCLHQSGGMLMAALSAVMQGFANMFSDAPPEGRLVYVWVVCTLTGGTGGGTFIDIAQMVRQLATPGMSVVPIGVLLCPRGIIADANALRGAGNQNAFGNAYAALRELDHSTNGNGYDTFEMVGGTIDETSLKPFDFTYLIEGINKSGAQVDGEKPLLRLVVDGIFSTIATGAQEQEQAVLINAAGNLRARSGGKVHAYSSMGFSAAYLDLAELQERLAAEAFLHLARQRSSTSGQPTIPTDGILITTEDFAGESRPELEPLAAPSFRTRGGTLIANVEAAVARNERAVQNSIGWNGEKGESLQRSHRQRVEDLVTNQYVQQGLATESIEAVLKLLRGQLDSAVVVAHDNSVDAHERASSHRERARGGEPDAKGEFETAARGGKFLMFRREDRDLVNERLSDYLALLDLYWAAEIEANTLEKIEGANRALIQTIDSQLRRLQMLRSAMEIAAEQVERIDRRWKQQAENRRKIMRHLVPVVDTPLVERLTETRIAPLFEGDRARVTFRKYWNAIEVFDPATDDSEGLPLVRGSSDATLERIGERSVDHFLSHESIRELENLQMLEIVIEGPKGEAELKQRARVNNLLGRVIRRGLPLWGPDAGALTPYKGSEPFTQLGVLANDESWREHLQEVLPPTDFPDFNNQVRMIKIPSKHLIGLYRTEHGLPLYALTFMGENEPAKKASEMRLREGMEPLYTRGDWPEGLDEIGARQVGD